MQLLRGRRSAVSSLAFSPCSRYLAAGESACCIWDLHQPGRRRVELVHREAVHPALNLTFFDGRAVYYIGYQGVLLDLTDGSSILFKDRSRQRSTVFGGSGAARVAKLLPFDNSGRHPRYKVTTHTMTADGLGAVVSVHFVLGIRYIWPSCFSPLGDRYLSYDRMRDSRYFLNLHDGASDRVLGTLWLLTPDAAGAYSPGSGACFSPDGSRVYLPFAMRIVVCDASNGREVARVELPTTASARAVAAHPAGRLLAAIESDREVTLRDAHTLRVLDKYDFDLPKLTAVAFSPDGTRCAVGNNTGKVLLFDVDG